MKGNIMEAVIGAVVLVIASFFMYFAYTTSGEKITDGYELVARFDDVGGLSQGADIKLNGIKIGVVKHMKIDENYQAQVDLLLKTDVKIPRDSSASVATDGLMGNKFIAISVGFEKEMLNPGEEIELTKSSVNLEKLIDRFFVGGVEKAASDRSSEN
jgi:phospholipid/cholesterol/gamma-HCH transport system substrate-binding protein